MPAKWAQCPGEPRRGGDGQEPGRGVLTLLPNNGEIGWRLQGKCEKKGLGLVCFS